MTYWRLRPDGAPLCTESLRDYLPQDLRSHPAAVAAALQLRNDVALARYHARRAVKAARSPLEVTKYE